MHFSITGAVRLMAASGKAYTGYEILVNGVFHSVARYRQFYALYQELINLGLTINCTFPPKTVLLASTGSIFIRILGLQTFLRTLGSDTELLTAAPTVKFFAHTREAYLSRQPYFEQDVRIHLLGRREVISLTIGNTDATDRVLRELIIKLNVPVEFTYAFGLFLGRSDSDAATVEHSNIIRQLYRFECPLMSLNEANKSSGNHQIILRKCCLSPAADFILRNEETAGLVYDQALADFYSGQFFNEHHAAPIPKALTSTTLHFAPRPAYSELLTSLRWLLKNVPLYGCLHIRECKIDASLFGKRYSQGSPTLAAYVPASLWVGRNALFITIQTDVSPSLSFRTSTDSGLGTAASNTSNEKEKSQPELLRLPLTRIQSWQLVTPDGITSEITAPPTRLLIQYSGQISVIQGQVSACTIAIESPPIVGELLADPLSAMTSEDDTIDLNPSPKFHLTTDVRELVIISDSPDQIFLLNESLLQLVNETIYVQKGQQVFDTLSSRLPENYLFPMHPVNCGSPFSSSISSLSETNAGGGNVRQALMSKARSLSNNFRRIFGAVRAPVINEDAETSQSPVHTESLLAKSAEDARKLLTIYDSCTEEVPATMNLEIPEEVPIGSGRLQLRHPVVDLLNEAST